MIVNYDELPGFNELFIEYINRFEAVSSFYRFDFKSEASFLALIKTVNLKYLKRHPLSRENLANILKLQNEQFNSGDETFANIELLKSENTFAIVTGQQVGILSGNFYTIIKSINAIQLSEYLKTVFPEYNFVPVFWLECDDHDFLEINNIEIFDRSNKLQKLEYLQNGMSQDKYLTPADRIIFDDNIDGFKNELINKLAQTEFTEGLKSIIDRSYKPGLSFPVTFARFMNFILKGKGMIFLNPADREFKKALIPVFEKELNTFPATCETVIKTSAMLEQDYHVQIKPHQINLFYTHNNNRYLVENKTGDVFSLKNSRQTFSREEIFNNLKNYPENFSANVVLRPVCQDYLLPTAAYIGGPAEVSYFGQLKKVYENFDVDMPVIYPRTSVTLLENRINNFLIKNEISFEDIFDADNLRKKIIDKISEVNVDEIISEYVKDLNTALWSISNEVRKIDKNLETLLKNKNDKYIESLEGVRKKLLDAQGKLHSSTMNKLQSVVDNLFPEGSLQERKINFTYFMNKYGLDLADYLLNEIDLKAEGHQVILLNLSGAVEKSR